MSVPNPNFHSGIDNPLQVLLRYHREPSGIADRQDRLLPRRFQRRDHIGSHRPLKERIVQPRRRIRVGKRRHLACQRRGLLPLALDLHQRYRRVVDRFVANTMRERIESRVPSAPSHRRDKKYAPRPFSPCLCASSMIAFDKSIGIFRSLPKWSSTQIFTKSTFLSASHATSFLTCSGVLDFERYALHPGSGRRISAFPGEASAGRVQACVGRPPGALLGPDLERESCSLPMLITVVTPYEA